MSGEVVPAEKGLKPPDRLFHYCGLGALRGIIESKSIHMTNVFWMTDTTEMQILFDLVRQRIVEAQLDSPGRKFDDARLFMDIRRPSHIFCACFSEDSDSISQWEVYGDKGQGYCVGVDPNALVCGSVPPNSVVWQKVKYEIGDHDKLAREIFEALDEHVGDIGSFLVAFKAGHKTYLEASSCKDPKFESEHEWRLVSRNDPRDGLRFRERADWQLVPYIEFPLDVATNPICEIWLGPRNQSQRNVDALKQLLGHSGYDVDEITFLRSKISLTAD